MTCFSKHNKLISIKKNLIDSVSKKNIKKTRPFFSLNKKIVGESHLSKIRKVIDYLKKNKTDFLFISAPENVAWILNIRGYDNPTSPIPNCRLIIGKNKKLFLIAKEENCQKIIKENIIKKNQLIDLDNFENFINKIKLNMALATLPKVVKGKIQWASKTMLMGYALVFGTAVCVHVPVV